MNLHHMKSTLIGSLLLIFSPNLNGQVQINWAWELNTLLDIEKKYYGLQLQLEKKLLSSASGRYSLSVGLSNEFHIVDEKDLEQVSGNTIQNQLGVILSNRIKLFKNQRFSLANTAYLAWSYRRTRANFSNPEYQINRDHSADRHFVGIGCYWKLDYALNDHWSVQLVAKTDLSRWLDEYEFELARPGLLYGLGIRKRF